jgi:RHS repeat-associated protein
MPRTATVGTETERYRQDAFERLVVRDQNTPPADYYMYDDVDGMNVVGMRRWTGGGGGRVLQKVDNYLYDGIDHPLRLQHRDPPDAPTFQTVHYEVDLVGNVRRLRGPAGEDLGGYRYTAFGKAYSADATTPAAQVDQPLRWKGRWLNARTGLYDVRARMWSPELGVFVNADEFALLRKDSTLWGWPGQNPLRYSDPTGRDAEEWFLRNGNYLAAGVAAVAVAPLAIVGAAEVVAAVSALETASAAATTAGIVQSSSTAIAEAIAAGGVATAPPVNDPRLQNIVGMLYRASDRFPGGTAAILRLEKLVGEFFSSRGHAQKAMEQLRRLEELLATRARCSTGRLQCHGDAPAGSPQIDRVLFLQLGRTQRPYSGPNHGLALIGQDNQNA